MFHKRGRGWGLQLAAGLGAAIGVLIAAGVTNGDVFAAFADRDTILEGVGELGGSAAICSMIGAILWLG